MDWEKGTDNSIWLKFWYFCTYGFLPLGYLLELLKSGVEFIAVFAFNIVTTYLLKARTPDSTTRMQSGFEYYGRHTTRLHAMSTKTAVV